MQFTKENAEKVMAGLKPKTRRPVADNDVFKIRDGVVWTYDKTGKLRRKWEVGKVYSVQPGRGKKGIGFIRLVGLRREKLQDISEADCAAELGCPIEWPGPGPEPYHRNLRQAFADLWDSIYPKGKRWADNQPVWVLSLEVLR